MSDRVPLSGCEFYCTDTRLIVRSTACSKADAPQHHEVNHSVGRTRLLRHDQCRFHHRDLSPREWPPAALSRHRTPLIVFENKYRYSWLVLFSHEVEGQERPDRCRSVSARSITLAALFRSDVDIFRIPPGWFASSADPAVAVCDRSTLLLETWPGAFRKRASRSHWRHSLTNRRMSRSQAVGSCCS